MKLQLAVITSLSFLMVGCCHNGNGCYNPSTGLVHSGPCGLFDNCGTGLCQKRCCKRKNCNCRSSCNACQFGGSYSSGPMTYGDGGVIYEGTGSAHCPTCQGQQSTHYPELMVPQDTPSNQIVPAPAPPADEDAPVSQTYFVPSTSPPASYSTPRVILTPEQMSSVPPIETSAF